MGDRNGQPYPNATVAHRVRSYGEAPCNVRLRARPVGAAEAAMLSRAIAPSGAQSPSGVRVRHPGACGRIDEGFSRGTSF